MQLLPEWHQQEAILLAWPDEQTDWHPWLEKIQFTYIEIIKKLNENHTGVVLLVRQTQIKDCHLKLKDCTAVLLVVVDYNDTWVRDYGFLSCQIKTGIQPVEFQFNGWGNKFNATKDNLINQNSLATLCQRPIISHQQVLEGGALEIDDSGHLLSTKSCLLSPQRNDGMTLQNYTQSFNEKLGVSKSTIFKNGCLQGDDTDGHIDTLVRFTPDRGLVVQSCFNRPNDEHFSGLSALVKECLSLESTHSIFELPLPLIKSKDSKRLPASYANFLINNGQVLCPVYNVPEDRFALAILQQAFTKFKIIPIDCSSLILQFGSLHCITMQIPAGTLKKNVIWQMQSGVSLYEQ